MGKYTSTCIEWMVQAQPNLHVIRTINVWCSNFEVLGNLDILQEFWLYIIVLNFSMHNSYFTYDILIPRVEQIVWPDYSKAICNLFLTFCYHRSSKAGVQILVFSLSLPVRNDHITQLYTKRLVWSHCAYLLRNF